MSLPSEAEQAMLLDALAELVEAQGHLPLVSSHLLEPTERYFPDAWQPSAAGVELLARRLLGYAGLEGLEVSLSIGEGMQLVESTGSSSVGGTGHSTRHAGAAGWFEGIVDGRCHFGVDVGQLQDPDAVVGTMCH